MSNTKPAGSDPARGSMSSDGDRKKGLGRRELITKLGFGVVTAAVGVPALMSIRSLVPNALYEKPRRFKAGRADQFAEGPTFINDQRVFIFRNDRTFYCISAVCTHLGCTVQLVKNVRARQGEEYEFQCPCHGSKFHGDGSNYDGPAPRPLDYFKLDQAPDDGQLIVDLSQIADKGWRFSV